MAPNPRKIAVPPAFAAQSNFHAIFLINVSTAQLRTSVLGTGKIVNLNLINVKVQHGQRSLLKIARSHKFQCVSQIIHKKAKKMSMIGLTRFT